MFIEIAMALVVIIVGFVYAFLKPPQSKICGSLGGPLVTSPRIRLRDGRYMAYVIRGAPLEKAKHKVVVCHGFRDGKDMVFLYSQELLEELDACFVIYDRPGYGESDPSKKRGPKSEAEDVEELADYLQLGSRFHIMGISMGVYVVWGCLMYLPHRLSGATFVCAFYNYYWSGFPSDLLNMCFRKQSRENQWVARISYYAPWLLYWFMTQNIMFKTNANDLPLTDDDLELVKKVHLSPNIIPLMEKAKQQGIYYSMHQDMLAAYGKWERSPLDIKNPFQNNEGTVHFWQGTDDKITPVELSRFLAKELPWIKYHELPGKGHFIIHDPHLCECIVRKSLN